MNETPTRGNMKALMEKGEAAQRSKAEAARAERERAQLKAEIREDFEKAIAAYINYEGNIGGSSNVANDIDVIFKGIRIARISMENYAKAILGGEK